MQTWGFSLAAVPAAPTIEFEEAAYQVREPPGPEGVAVLNIPVVRRGDHNRTSRVRCSTRDGSAQAGVDYYPKSRMLKFSPGEGASQGGLEVGAWPGTFCVRENGQIWGKTAFCVKFAVILLLKKAEVLNSDQTRGRSTGTWQSKVLLRERRAVNTLDHVAGPRSLH